MLMAGNCSNRTTSRFAVVTLTALSLHLGFCVQWENMLCKLWHGLQAPLGGGLTACLLDWVGELLLCLSNLKTTSKDFEAELFFQILVLKP